MAKTTTTPAAAHNDPLVFQTSSTDPQRQPQSSFSSSHSPLALRSATTIDLDASTALRRPAKSNTNARMKKRTPIRRTSPPRTRSMTRANSSLVQDSPSTSASLSSRSQSLAKPVARMTAPERTRVPVSTRATTTKSSASSVPSAASSSNAPAGRVRRAVSRLEKKILLHRQAQWPLPSLSSRALILDETLMSNPLTQNLQRVPVSASNERSSSAPASSTTPRRATRTHQFSK